MPAQSSPFPPGSKVAAYLRDSGGDEQDQSVGQQERAVRDWCHTNHLHLTTLFIDEARPGSSVIGREGFQRMISHFHGKHITEVGLVIWSFARFSRSMDDSLYYSADLRRRGYTIHSLTDSLPGGVDGKFFQSAILWQNEHFLENLSREVKRGVNDLIKIYGALGGTPPRGFMREAVELGKRRDGSPHIVHRWVPDPQMIDRVRLAWEMRASGSSYKQILAATHIYTSVNSFRTFFENRIYLGEMQFGETLIPDYVEPVIDQATWDAVQARMSSGRGHIRKDMAPLDNPRRAASRFILSGLVFCQACGSPMNGQVIPSKTGPAHDYYVCSGRFRRHDCEARNVPKEILEKTVLDLVREFILEPKTMEALRLQSKSLGENRAQDVVGKIAESNQQLGTVRQKINNILNAIEINPESTSLVQRLTILEAEERDITRHIKSLEGDRKTIRHISDDEMLARVHTLVSDVENIPLEDLKTILTGMISKVLVIRKEKTIEGMVLFYQAPDLVIKQNEFL